MTITIVSVTPTMACSWMEIRVPSLTSRSASLDAVSTALDSATVAVMRPVTKEAELRIWSQDPKDI